LSALARIILGRITFEKTAIAQPPATLKHVSKLTGTLGAVISVVRSFQLMHRARPFILAKDCLRASASGGRHHRRGDLPKDWGFRRRHLSVKLTIERVCRRYPLEGLQMRLEAPRQRIRAKLDNDCSDAPGANQGGRWTECTTSCSIDDVAGFSLSSRLGAASARPVSST
jgi:hypothetical protein